MRKPKHTPPCPSLLSRLYGEPNVVNLEDLLIRLSSLSSSACHLGATLVQPQDHRDYAQRLLGNTLCIVNPEAPVLRDGFSLQQHSNQTEVGLGKGWGQGGEGV